MKKIISLCLLATFYATSSAFAGQIMRTTCFQVSNYDFELELVHLDGVLTAVAFNNSDWSKQGPDLEVVELQKNEQTTTYLIKESKQIVKIENKVLQAQDGLARIRTEEYDCRF